MEGEVLTGLRTILELGWPAIVLVGWWIIWQKHNQRTDQYISDLREIAGLKASLRPLPPDVPTIAPPEQVKSYRASRAAYK